MAIEDGYLSSPASTPDSTIDEEKFLVNRFHRTADTRRRIPAKKLKWYYDLRNLPIAILCVSLLQILFHVYAKASLKKYLRFEPNKRLELWRYVTYMLVHEDWSHLALNVVIQCIFAAFLEINQGRIRVLAIYIIGGVTGVLGAACLHSELIVGASAGGYALLLANVADLVLNFETIKYKIYRSISITTLIIFDIIYDIVHVTAKKEPQISWQAHFFGGLTGIFLGLVLFKCYKPTKYGKPLWYIGLVSYILFVMSFIFLTVQIVACTPSDLIRYKYVYFC